jgi:hypothetical protein
MPRIADRALQALLDRDLITRLIGDWFLWRDSGNWPRLRACYTPDAVMHTTWFVGSAGEFVERSIEMAKKGVRSQHSMGATTIALNGERATAETRMMLLLRATLQGVEADVVAYARFYDFLLRHKDGWLFRRRIPIYEKDRIDPVRPGAALDLDAAELVRYPAAYRHVAYVQARGGGRITPDLPTVDDAGSVARLYAEGAEWLSTT